MLKNYPLKKGFFNKPPTKAKKPPVAPRPATTPPPQPSVLKDVLERPVGTSARPAHIGTGAPFEATAAVSRPQPVTVAAERMGPQAPAKPQAADASNGQPKRMSKFKQQRAGMI